MAHAINNSNIVVGERSVDETVAPRIAFAWSFNGGFDDLGLIAKDSAALAISENNLIVGTYVNPGNSRRTFIYDGAVLVTIGNPASTPRSVNRAGQVCGLTTISVGFIWANGEFEFVPPVGDDDISNVNALDEVGHALLRSYNSSTTTARSFLWIDDTFQNVQDFLPKESPFTVRAPVDLNNAGQLLVHANSGRALVITPGNRPRADLTGDCRVGIEDILTLFDYWATANPVADINDNGTVNVADLFLMLANWG